MEQIRLDYNLYTNRISVDLNPSGIFLNIASYAIK